MEFLKDLNIDYYIVLIVLVSGFCRYRLFPQVKLVKEPRLNAAYVTLIISFLVCGVYVFLGEKPNREMIKYYFISYFVATSLYELLIGPLIKWIEKLTNQKITTDEKNS